MKIKLDENLPERLVAALTALGHDLDTVRAERLSGQPDLDMWSTSLASAYGKWVVGFHHDPRLPRTTVQPGRATGPQ